MQKHTRYIQWYSYAQVITKRPSHELYYTTHFFVGNGIHANTYIYIHIHAYTYVYIQILLYTFKYILDTYNTHTPKSEINAQVRNSIILSTFLLEMEYMQIHTYTCIYMHICRYTCKYIHIHSNTYKSSMPQAVQRNAPPGYAPGMYVSVCICKYMKYLCVWLCR